MSYDELIAAREAKQAEMDKITAEIHGLDLKINLAKEGKAESLFVEILDKLEEMAELGYTISVETDDAEWGGKNWHELGISCLGLSVVSTDQQESILQILNDCR